MKDFVGEKDLYFKTNNLVEFPLSWSPAFNASSLNNMLHLYQDAMDTHFIGSQEQALIEAWVQDVEEILQKPRLAF